MMATCGSWDLPESPESPESLDNPELPESPEFLESPDNLFKKEGMQKHTLLVFMRLSHTMIILL